MVYKASLLGTWTIPFAFSKIERTNGKFQVSPTLSAGVGYGWFLGDFYFNMTDKISVDQTFIFGALADVSLQNNLNLKNWRE
jgi:hypothetical protein